jgi:hypothetical protein
MRGVTKKTQKTRRWLHHQVWPMLGTIASLSLLSLIVVHYLFTAAYGAQLGNRAINLGSSQVGDKSLYTLVFNLANSGIIGSMELQFCANDPIPENPCTAPAGLDASAAVLTGQSGTTGFTIDSAASNANTIILTRLPLLAAAGQATYSFKPIQNPSSPGSYYLRVRTFASPDASGQSSDYGGIAFAINNQVTINAEVPPYLLFCTGITITGLNCINAVGDYIDFGEFSSSHASSATSQLLVATNAEQGYAISIAGATLASGNNVITALSTGDVSRPGTGQFGFNLKANSAPGGGSEVIGPGSSQAITSYATANSYRFAPGDTIISSAVPDDVRVYTSNYITNVPQAQAPGIYVSTVTYVCLANF